MVSKSKVKGSKFERDIADKFNEEIIDGKFKRVAGSGALGTVLDEPALMGDVKGSVPSIPREMKIECKVGYGGASQLTFKREWLNKIIMEAKSVWGLGFLVGKFSGARKADGVQEFVVLAIEDFIWLVNNTTKLRDELDSMYDKIAES